MKTKTISINNKEYKVIVAESKEDKSKGLKGVTKLPTGKGMLFEWDTPQEVSMTMQDTKIPLHQIFIDEDGEIIKEAIREDINQNILISCDNTKWVLEINPDNTIQEGDQVEGLVEDDTTGLPVMKILAPDGSTQMELVGGERIVSRKESKVLIKKAKKAQNSKSDVSFKSLGKYMFNVLYKQDNRDPEYVELKN